MIMLRLSLASLLLALSGCMIGPGAKKLPPVQTGQGIVVALTTTAAPKVPSFQNHRAEVLAVQEESLLLLIHDLGSIFDISYNVIAKARFDRLKRLNFGKGRPPSPEQLEEMRLLSRFPQGVSQEMLHRLLATYHQNKLNTIP